MGDKFSDVPLLVSSDGFYWIPWPHEFNRLMRAYPKVPHSFWITLMHVWGATVGSVDGQSGLLAISQIPVRAKDARKWIERALTVAGFFRRKVAGQGDKEGSAFYVGEPKGRAEWEAFLESLSWVVEFNGLGTKVTTKRFGKLVVAGAQNPAEMFMRKMMKKR